MRSTTAVSAGTMCGCGSSQADGGPAVARIAGEQGAGVLSSLAAADALMIVPEAHGASSARNSFASDPARLMRPGSGRVVAKPLDSSPQPRTSPRRITRYRYLEESRCRNLERWTRCAP